MYLPGTSKLSIIFEKIKLCAIHQVRLYGIPFERPSIVAHSGYNKLTLVPSLKLEIIFIPYSRLVDG